MDRESADIILQLNDSHFVTRTLHVVAELGIADHLGDTPMTVAELAARVGAQADPLARVLRLLSSRGIFKLEGGLAEGLLSHTPPSRLLATNHPASLRPFVRNTATIRSWRLPEHMLEMVKTGRPAMAEGSMWNELAASPEDGRIFDAAMTAKAHVQIEGVLRAQDFSPYSKIVDIGGGAGHLLRAVLAQYPQATGVLFDRPDVVAAAANGGDAAGRLEFVGGDFFVGVPSGDLTMLMDVLHDWDDTQCVGILNTVRRTMSPNARLLIIETEVAPDNGRDFGKLLDIIMMTLFAGRQRSKAEYEALFSATGFRLVSAVPTDAGPTLFTAEPV